MSSENSEPNEVTYTPAKLNELSNDIQNASKDMGWDDLTDVQSQSIPYMLAKQDMLVQAKTGSGKTGAYLLPLLDMLSSKEKSAQALILVPTRELAVQVSKEAEKLLIQSKLNVVAVYGGSSYKPQIDAFKKGVQIVVATPGRVLDHLLKRNLKLNNLRCLIFDEADRLLSMGFYEDMKHLMEFLSKKVPSFMFSATFPTSVIRLANEFLHKSIMLHLSKDEVHVKNTLHVAYKLPGMEKDRALIRLIEMENPSQAIIFCNTKDRVNYISRVLQRFGYNADQLSSDLSQRDRERVLGNFKNQSLRFLVATDVAARGIDVEDMSHVFQFEPPEDMEVYIHRAGRTGRAGATGTAIMLLDYAEEKYLKRIAAHYKIEFEERKLPSEEEFQATVSQRLVGQLEGKLRDRDRLQIERMGRFDPLVTQLYETEEGKKLLSMLLDDQYHSWMHKPFVMPSPRKEKAENISHKPKKKKKNFGSRNPRRKG
jgi:ATP-dependent RNA helicase DeaD